MGTAMVYVLQLIHNRTKINVVLFTLNVVFLHFFVVLGVKNALFVKKYQHLTKKDGGF